MTKHSIITRAKGVVITTPGDFKDSVITIGGQKFTQDEFNELSKTVQSHMDFIKEFNKSVEKSPDTKEDKLPAEVPPGYVFVKTFMGKLNPYDLYMIPKPFDPVKWFDLPAPSDDSGINLPPRVENELLPTIEEAYDCMIRYKTEQHIIDSTYTEFWEACGDIYDVASDTICPSNSYRTLALPYFKVIRVQQPIIGN